ncbi:MAG: YaiO family outer rane beta-barrel protein [Bacteroidota bacterium]|jgi:YaiO family outer membrane protein
MKLFAPKYLVIGLMTLYKHLLLILLFTSSVFKAHAMAVGDSSIVITDTTNIDQLYKTGIQLSYKKDFIKARAIFEKILEVKPSYTDVRTSLARAYMWDKKYEEARTQLGIILTDEPYNVEALVALIDVETWIGNNSVAQQYLKQALGNYPNNEDLLIRKAKVQFSNNEKENGAITLRKVLDVNPGNKEALEMLQRLDVSSLNNRMQVSYEVDYFDQTDLPQQYAAVEAGHSFKFGTFIGRVGLANRFDRNGVQYEVDGYLKLIKNSYMYVNGGYSASTIFPEYRAGLEHFHKLGAGFELSGGFRYLYFDQPGVTVYTMSLGNYFKKYWISARAFVTPRKNDLIQSSSFALNNSVTVLAFFRNYFGDADNFFGMRLGSGQSPDQRRIIDKNPVRLRSYQGAFEYQKRIFNYVVMRAELGFADEQVTSTRERKRLSFGINFKTLF